MKLYKNKIVVDGVESALNIAVGDGTTGTAITYTLTKEDNNIILTGSDGSITSILDSNTIYNNATSSAAGLMSKDDKAKLDGITANANSVSFSRSLTSGTKIGTITINGTGTELYAPIDTWRPVVDNLTSTATDSSLSANQGKVLKGLVDGKAASSHTHDDRYYTESEIDTKLSGKSDTSHTHTKADIGLDSVTNDAQVKRSEMGAASGVATLGTDGKVPSSQLPSYVDDVLEYNGTTNFPRPGESGKIYVDTSNNKTYRWSGSTYVEISTSIVVGTTTGTAFDGKIGNDHINNKSNPHGVTKAQIGLGNVENKSSATIRGELTKANVTDALGYTPPTANTWRPVIDNLTSTDTDSSLSAAQGKTLKDLIDNQATNITNLKKPQSVTLGTSWSQDTTNGYYTQTVALSGITSKDNPTIDVVLSGTLSNMQAQQDDWDKILKVETSTNTLTFYASEATTVALSVIVKGV